MRLKLIIALLFFSSLAQAQEPPGSKYTPISQRYNWLAGYFRALHLPAYGDTVLQSGQWTGAGAVLIDTTDEGASKGLYIYYDRYWHKAGMGESGGNGIHKAYGNFGLFNINDSTLRADTNFVSGIITAWRLQKTRDSLAAIISGRTLQNVTDAGFSTTNKISFTGNTGSGPTNGAFVGYSTGTGTFLLQSNFSSGTSGRGPVSITGTYILLDAVDSLIRAQTLARHGGIFKAPNKDSIDLVGYSHSNQGKIGRIVIGNNLNLNDGVLSASGSGSTDTSNLSIRIDNRYKTIPNFFSRIVDTVMTAGDSYTQGTGVTTDSIYANRFADKYGFDLLNSGATGSGFFRFPYQMSINRPAFNNDVPVFVALGLNDIRYGGSNYLTLKKIENGARSGIFYQFMISAVPGSSGSVTKTGTWVNRDTWTDFYGKALHLGSGTSGIWSGTASSTASWPFTSDHVGIGFIGRGIDTAGVFRIYIDNVLVDSVDVANQEDGSDLATGAIKGIAAVKIISGLTNASHTVKVEIKSGNVIIDYFGYMGSAVSRAPIAFSSIFKLPAAGWAAGSATAGSNDAADAGNIVIKKVIQEFRKIDRDYPVFWYDLPKYFDYSNDIQVDLIHPNEQGNRHYLAGMEDFVFQNAVQPDGITEQYPFNAGHFESAGGATPYVLNSPGSVQTGFARLSGISQFQRGITIGAYDNSQMTIRTSFTSKNVSFMADTAVTPGTNIFRWGPSAGANINSSAANLTLIHYGAGGNITSGTNDFFAGVYAGNSTNIGNSNTGINSFALQLNESGSSNVAVGDNTAKGTNASYRTVVGSTALLTGGGDGSSEFGFQAGYNKTVNSTLGLDAGYAAGLNITDQDGCVNIGPGSNPPSASGNGWGNYQSVIFVKNGYNNTVASTTPNSGGMVGVMVADPLNTLDIGGDLRIRTIANTSAKDSVLVQDAGIVKYVDLSAAGVSESDDNLTLTGTTLGTNTVWQTITFGSPTSTFTTANGVNGVLTATANTAVSIPSPQDGKVYMIKYIQDGTGGWQPTVPGGSTPVVNLAASSVTYLVGIYQSSGTTWKWTSDAAMEGDYTPTLTAVANITGSPTASSNSFHWMRVGNMIIVSGVIAPNLTAGSTFTQIDISLPFASALTAANQLTGNGTCAGGSLTSAIFVTGDATNDRAASSWVSSGTGVQNTTVTFMYKVL